MVSQIDEDEGESAAQTAAAKLNAVKVFLISTALIIPFCIYLIFFANGIYFKLSGHGMVALILAIVLCVLSAFVFMGMSFFSSRSGIDDQPNYREIVEKQCERDPKKVTPAWAKLLSHTSAMHLRWH